MANVPLRFIPRKWRKTAVLVFAVLASLGALISRQQYPDAAPVVPQPTVTRVIFPSETLPASSSGSVVTDTDPVSAVVKRVIDGDTIELSDGRRVRYIGIDAPESVDPRRGMECYGKEASARNSELVEGKTVVLEKDISQTDRFGRLLRYVWVGDTMINEVLVREGFAQVSTYPPDVTHNDRFMEAQRQAQSQKAGLWGQSCR